MFPANARQRGGARPPAHVQTVTLMHDGCAFDKMPSCARTRDDQQPAEACGASRRQEPVGTPSPRSAATSLPASLPADGSGVQRRHIVVGISRLKHSFSRASMQGTRRPSDDPLLISSCALPCATAKGDECAVASAHTRTWASRSLFSVVL